MDKTKSKNPAVVILLIVVFIFISIFALLPLFALLLASFKPATELLRYGLNLQLQLDLLSWDNYAAVFSKSSNFLIWFKNSIIIVVIYTILCLFFSAMVGYALAVYHFKLRNIIFGLVLIVMMIPLEIIMLPLFKLSITLRLMNTFAGAYLPFVLAPLPIFFFRQYAMGLPRDFMDAARVDGCTEYGVYFRIMLPLMTPAFTSMAILQALFSWNNFLWPLIVLRTTDKLTVPIGLASLVTPYGNNYQILIAGSMIAIIPILILYAFFQRYFIEGMTVGGVKG